MTSRALAVGALSAALLAACSSPQRLPVGVSVCNAVQSPAGFEVTATIKNTGDRPISDLTLATSFYQNFRYQTFAASAKLRRELDPGASRDVLFNVADSGRAAVSGQAMRCYVTRIGYLDGTSVSTQ